MPSQPIIVKRYAGSRLYDTARACYVTVEDLRRWQSAGVPFVVRDADSGEDLTRAILA
jgi:polyhydroxyalkanoate synthesis repressor PhaR